MKNTQILSHLEIYNQNKGGFAGIWSGSGKTLTCVSPIDGQTITTVDTVDEKDLEEIMAQCAESFQTWKSVPAPVRGRLVKDLASEINKHKDSLAELITLEMGKCKREALGEIQEMIDAFDYAVGLSRQLSGPTMPSERIHHRIQEQWHPLGMVSVITAFNFPMAVWSWNTALALVCGNPILWKPSSKTPLSAIACTKIAERVLLRNGFPPAVCSLVIGPGERIGSVLASNPRVALVSFTGSVPTGRKVAKAVQDRFGRHILELGGNNAVIVSNKGDLEIALRTVYFGAIGTSGQRCTTSRRVIIHDSVFDQFIGKLKRLYQGTQIGDPRDGTTIMGPLADLRACETMLQAIEKAELQGGRIIYGGERLSIPGGCYVTPCLVESERSMPIVQEETFAPILYLMRYSAIEEAIAIQNAVPQGLSSAIITNDIRESELFLSAVGSDCGIANVNCGTSGAEIGGAFGGEKETGGGRECGSDSWKAYMRRQTSTINFGTNCELAQGIQF